MADQFPDRATIGDVGLRRESDIASGAPRWVKLFAAVAAAVTILVVALLVAGGGPGAHGPGRHTNSGGDVTPSSATGPDRAAGHKPTGGANHGR